MSNEVNDVVQGEGGGAVAACDEVGRLLSCLLVGRAGPGSDAGGVWRLLDHWRSEHDHVCILICL